MRNVSWLLVGFLLTLPGAVFAGMPFPMGGEGSNGLSTTAANALYVQLAGGIMTGQLVNRLDPAGTALTDASVLVNPGTCASTEILLGTGVAGAYRLSTDCEGDMLVAGTLGVTGATTPQISATHATYAANYTTATGATGLSEILSYNTNNSAYLGLSVFGSSYAAAGNDWGSSTAPGSAQVLLRPGDAAGDGIIGLAVDGRNLVFGTTVAGTRYNRAQISSAGTISLGTSTPSTFSSTGAATMSSTLDAKGAISNSGASNSGSVYVDDSMLLSGKLTISTSVSNAAFIDMKTTLSADAVGFNLLDTGGTQRAQVAYGNSGAGAPYAGNLYLYTPSGTGLTEVVGGTHITAKTNALIQNKVAVQMDTFMRLASATYATTDCDAAAEVGRVVMHQGSANRVTACICVQTAASTYSFAAIPLATGVCP